MGGADHRVFRRARLSGGAFLSEYGARGIPRSAAEGFGMLNPAEVHIWRVRLNRGKASPPTAGEAERAARFATPTSISSVTATSAISRECARLKRISGAERRYGLPFSWSAKSSFAEVTPARMARNAAWARK